MTHPKIQEMLDKAERDILQLRKARTSDGARKAWASFLDHANKAVNRLEGYSKRTGQYDKYKELLKELWATNLSRYMRAARNMLEHGVDDVEITEPYNSRIAFPDGHIVGAPIIYATTAEKSAVVVPAAGPAEILDASPGVTIVGLKPGIRMVPILSPKGEMIFPPTVDLALADEPEPLAAARHYLKWITMQIEMFA